VLQSLPLKSGSFRGAVLCRLKPREAVCGTQVISLESNAGIPVLSGGMLVSVGTYTGKVFLPRTVEVTELAKCGYFLLTPGITRFC